MNLGLSQVGTDNWANDGLQEESTMFLDGNESKSVLDTFNSAKNLLQDYRKRDHKSTFIEQQIIWDNTWSKTGLIWTLKVPWLCLVGLHQTN